MRRATAFLVPLLAACASAGGPPAPPALSYEMPPEPTAIYVQHDTALVEVDAGGQTIDVTVTSRATLALAFAPEPDGSVRVTLTYRELMARAENPMAPPQEVTEDAVEGDLVFTLSRRGEGTVVSVPEIDSDARSFISPSVTAASFFPRLPGRAVVAGDSWTDTVSIDAEEGETTIEATSIITYTVVGDTVVGGQRYLHVALTAEDERYAEATQMGMDVAQDVVGSSEGWFLWDPVRRLPAEIVIRSEGDGTMEVSAAPFPLSLKADNSSRVVLQGMGGGM